MTMPAQPQEIRCPSCNQLNLIGTDRCEQCLHSLMQRDLPRPSKTDTFQNVMMTSPISELITGKDLLVAHPEDSIQKVVRIFQKKKKGCLVVYQNKKLVGILGHRDLLKKIPDMKQDLSKIKVESVMTPNPEYVMPDAPIAHVVNKMSMGGFRHVPVLAADGTPLSIITIQDVLSYLAIRDKGGTREQYILPDPL